MIFTIDATDDDRRDQHNEWFDASTRDKLAEALTDENGLRPTEAALDVILAVVAATDDVDQNYTGRGAPTAVRYASAARHALAYFIGKIDAAR